MNRLFGWLAVLLVAVLVIWGTAHVMSPSPRPMQVLAPVPTSTSTSNDATSTGDPQRDPRQGLDHIRPICRESSGCAVSLVRQSANSVAQRAACDGH